VEADLAVGEIRIRGRDTSWVGPSAVERGRMEATRRNLEFIRRRSATGGLRVASESSVAQERRAAGGGRRMN